MLPPHSTFYRIPVEKHLKDLTLLEYSLIQHVTIMQKKLVVLWLINTDRKELSTYYVGKKKNPNVPSTMHWYWCICISSDTAVAFGWNIGNRKTVVVIEYLWLFPVQKWIKKKPNQSKACILVHSSSIKAQFVDTWASKRYLRASMRAFSFLLRLSIKLFLGEEKKKGYGICEFVRVSRQVCVR